MVETLADGRVSLWTGDSREVLKGLADASVDSVVTDPPYGLGFMGKEWDTHETAFDVAFWSDVLRVLKPGGHVAAFGGTRSYHRLAVAIEDAGFEIRDQLAWVYGSGFPKSHNQGGGWGTALKPAWEPIVLARKPLIGTVAANVLAHGTGALNIDATRVGTDEKMGHGGRQFTEMGYHGGAAADGQFQTTQNALGRWPANLVHDGSAEVVECFPEAGGGYGTRGNNGSQTSYSLGGTGEVVGYGDSGSAARFFYTAKADADDRLGSKHPTVKPLDLMQWLVRLATPIGGVVLDPFAGTGTTGEAAWREGMKAILIEREEAYCTDIRRRMKHILSGPDERMVTRVKERGGMVDPGPLFAWAKP